MTSSVIVDGAVIVQMLKPAAAKKIAEYVYEIFIPYSLKGTARAKRGKGVRRRVVACIPGNWHDFLHVDRNKTEPVRGIQPTGETACDH